MVTAASRIYRTSPGDLPFKPGESPFKTKGNAYNSLKAFHATQVPGGVAAVADALDPDLRAFYSQTFLAAGWYDFLPMQLLEKVAISIVGLDSATFLRRLGLHVVERDMKGVHKLLLHFTSPEAAIKRFSGVFRQYYNFGASRVVASEPGHSELEQDGMPRISAPVYQGVAAAFAQRLIELAGATNVTVENTPFEPCGVEHGLTLVRWRAITRWR